MRSSEELGTSSRIRGDEGGAVAVIVAILFATVFFAAAAVAIDLGSLWASQRSLVTDTDAAALSAARTLSEMTRTECESQQSSADLRQGQVFEQVEDVLAQNSDIDELLGVEIACGQRAGKVSVVARQPAISVFAAAVGVNDLGATGRSIAEWTRPGFNPIPLAVCESQLESVDAPEEEVIISYKSAIASQNSDCLDWLTEILGEETETASPQYAPGNWGWLEFDDLFDGQEFLGGIVCELDSTGYWCDGRTGGSMNNSEKLFENLRDDEEAFQFVLFDYTRNPNNPDQTASGTNAEFRINAVVEAQLIACAKQSQHLPEGRANGCTGNPSYLVLNVQKVTEFGAEDVEGRRADVSICGDSSTDRCRNQDF